MANDSTNTLNVVARKTQGILSEWVTEHQDVTLYGTTLCGFVDSGESLQQLVSSSQNNEG